MNYMQPWRRPHLPPDAPRSFAVEDSTSLIRQLHIKPLTQNMWQVTVIRDFAQDDILTCRPTLLLFDIKNDPRFGRTQELRDRLHEAVGSAVRTPGQAAMR